MLGKVLKSKAYAKSVIFKCTLDDTVDRIKTIVNSKHNDEDIDFMEFPEDIDEDELNVEENISEGETEENHTDCNFTFRDVTQEEDDIQCKVKFRNDKDSKKDNSNVTFNFEDIISDINDTDKEEKVSIKDEEQTEINDILKDMEKSPIFNGVSSMDRIVNATGINQATLEEMEHLTKKVVLEIGFILDKENIKNIIENIKPIKNTRFYKIKELREVLRDDFTFVSSTTNKLLDERYVGMVDIDRSLDDMSVILMKDNKSFISVRSSDDDYTIRFYSYSCEENKYTVIEETKVIKYKE